MKKKYITKKSIIEVKRARTSHKGDNGSVLIIGGSRDYIGAVALSGLAALKIVDLVTIAAPEKVAWSINCLSPDLITKKLKGDYFSVKHADEIIRLSKKFDSVLIGNGIGLKSKTFIKKIVKKANKPMVIDADAIKAISIKEVKNAIITPHAREFEMLIKNSKIKYSGDINKNIKAMQKIMGNNVILLKRPVDIIFSKNKTMYNKTGNPGMTRAGTGDVLAGLCAGFLVATGDLFKSACISAYLNGKVADYLQKKYKYEYFASDIIANIEKLYKK